MRILQISTKRIVSLVLMLSLVICIGFPTNAEGMGTGTLIEITPYTNIDELPGLEIDSPVYNDLKCAQLEMKRETRLGMIPNYIMLQVSSPSSTQLTVSVKNIGIDTIDAIRIILQGYNHTTGGAVMAHMDRTEYAIRPLSTRVNYCYVQPSFKYASINLLGKDGSATVDKTFFYYR